MTVVVSGAIANKYRNGGAAWTRLSWVLGLKRLGFSVHFAEQIRRASCIDANGRAAAFQESANLAYFRDVTEAFGLGHSATLICEDGEETCGLTRRELLDLAESADVLINISGHLTWDAMKVRVRRKVYIDQDPGFTQFWQASGNPGARLHAHDFYFTVGENIGTPACRIPTCGIRWRPTRQPVVLEHWPPWRGPLCGRFTTVGSWRGPYGPVQYGGTRFRLKGHEFRKFIDLPERVPQTFEVALDIHPADEKDLAALCRHGWRVVDPKAAVPYPDAFRRYVQQSDVEFSVAQGIYVQTRSGWFSDRTARYLASGKPALVQETGFSRNYPVGEGLLAFRTLEEAVAGAHDIARRYDAHSRAARALAEAYFDSDNVLGRLMDEVGTPP